MGYTAGSLELNLLGYSDGAVTSIKNTVKALNSLSNALNKINNTQFVLAGQKIEHIFTQIAKATNAINTNNIIALATTSKALGSISKIGSLEKVDFDKIGKGFQNLTVAITPFVEKVQSAEASLTALYGVLSKSGGKKIQNLLDGGKPTTAKSGGTFGFLNVAKWGSALLIARRMGRAVANIVQAGSDYNETLNLWQVAMRDNLDMAEQFVNKMNKAYGISTKTVMNAQAIFKNMIGSLGQITDDVAYRISEALVQMSADFSSLYNVQLESAFTKMQSMLAGQVRPIRSAGLDMTETTLFMFYQQLGGTKTMRQLTRTEKQLLSILAVYQQMGSAGALGDMSKTLNQYANQSRMLVEYTKELKTWTGLLVKDWLDQTQIIIYINALLITMTEVVKAIAKSKGLGQENFIDGLFESAEATNGEIDELQGKLLDFDKFRSLEGAETGQLAIDEKLLEALTGYSSKLDQAQNKAQQLAESWKVASGLFDETGVFQIDKWEQLVDKIEMFGHALLAIIASKAIIGIVNGIKSITLAGAGLQNILLTGVIFAILQAIDAFRDGEYVTFAIATAIGVGLVGALVAYKLAQYNSAKATATATLASEKQSLALTKQAYQLKQNAYMFKNVTLAIGAMVASYGIATGIISAFEGEGRKVASVCSLIFGGLMLIVGGIVAIKSQLSAGWALPTALAGLGAVFAGVQGLTKKAQADLGVTPTSLPDNSVLSTASSMGASVSSYTPTSTGASSASQLKSAVYQALVEYGNNHSSSEGDIVIKIGEEEVFKATRSGAKKQGLDFVKV